MQSKNDAAGARLRQATMRLRRLHGGRHKEPMPALLAYLREIGHSPRSEVPACVIDFIVNPAAALLPIDEIDAVLLTLCR